MGQHGSARLSVHSRLTIAVRVIEQGWTVTAAATAANVSRQTASKWVRRFREEGETGLRDRSTTPRRIHRRIAAEMVRAIEHLRRTQRLGPHRIGWALGLAASTVYAVLRRLGLHRLKRLEPRPEVIRYEWPAPGDLVHLDTKKLGRIDGVGKRFGGPNRGGGNPLGGPKTPRRGGGPLRPPRHRRPLAAGLRRAAPRRARPHGGGVPRAGARVLRRARDRGRTGDDRQRQSYVSGAFAGVLAARGIRHLRTRPYTPRTNGKAEAMVKVLINSWAYARPYRSSAERAEALSVFLDFYNLERPHGGLNGTRPIDRVRQ